MPSGKDMDGEPYTAVVGPENDQKLIMADTRDWAADESVQIVCESGHVDLAEWQ